MKKLITGILCLFCVFIIGIKFTVSDVSTPQTLQSLISLYSTIYDVSPTLMTHIAINESEGSTTIIGDMDIVCKRTGKPVRSRGVVQISVCYHPEVTDAESFNPQFSIKFLAENIKEGNCHEWSTCIDK